MQDIRDAALGSLVREVFAGHARAGKLELNICVRGGIAHIAGTVARESDLFLVRNLAARIRGIDAVWDVLAIGNRRARVLDVGCGGKKQVRPSLGVDMRAWRGVDVVADLAKGLPFRNGSIDALFTVHCLEHIADLIAAMAEIHRILSPWGVAHIMVPLHGSTNAVADPTHIRFFNRQTFKYFCSRRPGIPLFRPVAVSATSDNILADLSPVKPGQSPAAARELALFFD
jgi:SAM-dependent methyltransferase